MTALVTSRLAPRKRATTYTTRKPSFPRFRPPLVGPLVRRLAIRQPIVPPVFCLVLRRSLPRNLRSSSRTVIYPSSTNLHSFQSVLVTVINHVVRSPPEIFFLSLLVTFCE